MEKLPLFPLPSQILPEGMLPLRIFEQKYQRLIKESLNKYRGFGVVMVDNRKISNFGQIMPIGTRVEIVDFYTLADGLLGVTVHGVEKFRLHHIHVELDGLKVADIEPLPNWSEEAPNLTEQHLAEKLQDVFSQYPELDELYENKEFNNISWLCQRWLEILPMPVLEKQVLIENSSNRQSRAFLSRIIKHS